MTGESDKTELDVRTAANRPVGVWIAAPARHQRDQETGVDYDVVTGGIGNNRHIYFNRANFTHDGRQLIFLSDRTGTWQVYAYDTVVFCRRDAEGRNDVCLLRIATNTSAVQEGEPLQ